VLTPDARAPAWALRDAAAIVAPAGAAIAATAPARRYVLGSEAPVERGDVEFRRADDWARRLLARFEAQDYAEPTRRAIKFAAARRLAIDGQIVAAAAAAAATTPGRPTLLVAGRDDWRPIAHDLLLAGLGAAGFLVLVTAATPESRLAFARHVARMRGAPAPVPPAGPPAAVLAPDPPPPAAALVVGDLRAAHEPRRAPTLRALLARLAAAPGGAALLEPWSGRIPQGAAARRLAGLGLGAVAPIAFLRRDLPHAAAQAAARPRLDAEAAALAGVQGAAAFLLEAARKTASEWPAARAAGAVLERWAQAGGRRCFLLQGAARFEACVCAEAFRRAGAPAIEIHATLISESPRYDPPAGDHVACLDDAQAAILRRLDPEGRAAVHLVGSHEIDLMRAAAAARRPGRPEVVYFPSQGLPRLDAAALRMTLAADLPARGLRLEVSPHPSMTAREEAALEAAVGAPLVWSREESLRRALAPDVLAVVTLYSNVAFRAAALGRPVLVARIMGVEPPVALDALGLAERFSAPTELALALDRLLLTGGAPPPRLAAYLARNPQLVEGACVERIAAIAAG
jgi:hypothetical protein